MAVVQTFIAPNGATVRFHDDCLAKTPEENQRRRESTKKYLGKLYVECVNRNWREWKKEHPYGTEQEFLQEFFEKVNQQQVYDN